MDETFLPKLAIPGVLLLITFLAYSSQLLFLYLEPGPLGRQQSFIFNGLLICLLTCYARSCRTDPGRVPRDWRPGAEDERRNATVTEQPVMTRRWCRKCEAPKPPRAHHCRLCQRCILKMDHHCPWTLNCVSHVVFPHFIRFLFYAVAAMTCLGYFLYQRAAVIFHHRNLPSYLGPSIFQFCHLFILIVTNFLTWFALIILFFRTAWSLASNITTIESWEIERHATLVRRAKYFGGYLDGPDGQKVRIAHQEFPYDIGIWENLKQGMGTGNPALWFWPLSANLSVESGLEFCVNDFEDPDRVWPPPDPDRMPRAPRAWMSETPFVHEADDIEAFRRRQEEDLKRWNRNDDRLQRRQPFIGRLEARMKRQHGDNGQKEFSSDDDNYNDEGISRKSVAVNTRGEEAWKNSEGDSLADFGLDEDVEFYDEEDIPLSLLMRRKQSQKSD